MSEEERHNRMIAKFRQVGFETLTQKFLEHMALDALIIEVIPYTGGCTLVLEDRVAGSHEAGQPRLEIQDPTVLPNVGDSVWGGSDFAHIVMDGLEYPYIRIGYTKLVQDWPSASLAVNSEKHGIL